MDLDRLDYEKGIAQMNANLPRAQVCYCKLPAPMTTSIKEPIKCNKCGFDWDRDWGSAPAPESHRLGLFTFFAKYTKRPPARKSECLCKSGRKYKDCCAKDVKAGNFPNPWSNEDGTE